MAQSGPVFPASLPWKEALIRCFLFSHVGPLGLKQILHEVPLWSRSRCWGPLSYSFPVAAWQSHLEFRWPSAPPALYPGNLASPPASFCCRPTPRTLTGADSHQLPLVHRKHPCACALKNSGNADGSASRGVIQPSLIIQSL